LKIILSISSQRLHLMKVVLIDRSVKKRTDLEHRIVRIEQPSRETRNESYFKGLGEDLKVSKIISVEKESTALLLSEIMIDAESVLEMIKPDFILLYGSDLAALAVALLAVQKKIPLGHINAGLRNFDKSSPGEINSILVDHMSQLLFCSTSTTVDNLVNEGITSEIRVVGDLILEMLKMKRDEISQKAYGLLKEHDLKPEEYVLADIRFRKNLFPGRLSKILSGLISSNKKIVLLTYKRLNEAIKKNGIDIGKIKCVEDSSYLDTFALISNAEKVVCDSESMEREGYFYKKPTVVLRNTTVWNEILTNKWMTLVDSDKERIRNSIIDFGPSESSYRANLFGTGFNVADDIVEEIYKIL